VALSNELLPIHHLLLLAMMLDEPKHGYQLKREAGWIMGHEALHNNIVYPLLRRFLEEKWVSRKEIPGERGQRRQQYALTQQGRRHLFARLNTFGEAEARSEDAFHLRVGLFPALKPESRHAILAAREGYLNRRNQKLGALQGNLELGKFGGEVVRYCADTSGNIFLLDANGAFDTTLDQSGFPANGNYGNAFLRLSTSSGLAVADYFEMHNEANENSQDIDLGSGGALLLSQTDAAGKVWQLAVGAGKDKNLYVVDRTNMGRDAASPITSSRTGGRRFGHPTRPSC
jgi:DNA-binding PadR family transcriptional regulator